jgi:hypothetical protein
MFVSLLKEAVGSFIKKIHGWARSMTQVLEHLTSKQAEVQPPPIPSKKETTGIQGQMWWCTPVFLATWKVETEGS